MRDVLCGGLLRRNSWQPAAPGSDGLALTANGGPAARNKKEKKRKAASEHRSTPRTAVPRATSKSEKMSHFRQNLHTAARHETTAENAA
ncbi:hypothetical protein VTK26DRAFT_3468 [Humicola hyalothermophila]